MKQYMIDEGQLLLLKHISKRLFTEDRMNGDDMRAYAQALSGVIAVCEQIEIPENVR